MREIVERLTENRQVELAKSILESNGYKVIKKSKRLKESAVFSNADRFNIEDYEGAIPFLKSFFGTDNLYYVTEDDEEGNYDEEDYYDYYRSIVDSLDFKRITEVPDEVMDTFGANVLSSSTSSHGKAIYAEFPGYTYIIFDKRLKEYLANKFDW